MANPTITVELDGRHVPLTDCCWLQRATCGCVVAVSTAAVAGGRVLATAEQAHANLVPSKRERTREIKEGLTFELITFAHYRAEIGTQWECPAHVRTTPAAAALEG